MLVSKVLRLCGFLVVIAPLFAQQVDNTPNTGGLTAFDGPDILGRAGPTAGVHGTEPLPIHVQASLNASYDSSILGYSVTNTGTFRPTASVGVDLNAGISGRKSWRRTFIGIDYSGGYSHYASNSFYNGTIQQLSLGIGTMIGRKLQLSSQIGAGTSNRFVGGTAVFNSNEFEFLSAPTQELFDSRSYFVGISSSANYLLSRRASIRFSGNVQQVKRKARGLVDMTSYGAATDYAYRLSRRTSVGVSFAYSHYDFVKVFGDSDIYTFGTHFGRQFGRDWSFKGGLTMSQQSTVGVRTIALDPVLSAILGRNSGAEVFESNNLVYGYNASISRVIRHSNVSFSANRGINPGNGYFLTSVSQTFSASFSHAVSRNLSLNSSLSYNKLTSLGFASGAFSSWSAGGGATYKLSDSFGVNGHYDWRTFDLRQTTFGRTGFRVSMGITYFPKQSVAHMW